MFYSTSGPDDFNKSTRRGQGTLIQNWQEERVLREETGEGRTLSRGHINKNHLDLFTKTTQELGSIYSQNSNQDETFGRVFGRKHDPNFQTEHKEKYTRKVGYHEAEFGMKHHLIQRQFLNEISKELESFNKNDAENQNQRYLNSTYRNEFAQKNVGLNALGRKVMRDQNGKSLVPSTRDEDLLVDHGFLNKNPISTEDELKAAVKKESYVRAQPYTFWAEKANDGAYYNSKQTGDVAPFTRNNDFLKTYHNYTHIKN